LIYAGAGSAGVVAGSTALWRLLRTDAGPSIAVLPFFSADSALDYLSDGITEDVINNLGQLSTLRVMSHAAVYRYKTSNLVPQELGRALNVRFLLTGRIARNADSISVAVELTESASGVHLWGQQYERRMSEIAAIEEDVCREVLGKLNLQWGPDERKRLASRSSVSAEANELYWRGRFFWNKRTQEGLRKGIEYFEQAIGKDPNFALAYTGLADCYAMQSGIKTPAEVYPKAKAAAQKALTIDETLAEAHASLAFIHLFYDWDWLQTDKEYRRAIQLNPNYPTAHSMRGMYLVAMGRFGEALVEMRRALELDPASVVMSTGVGRVLFYARRYRDAAEQYNETLELDPNFPEALFDLGKTLAAQGKPDQAIRLLERGLKVSTDAGALAEMAYVHRRAGRTAEAEYWVQSLKTLAGQRYVSPYFLAVAQIGASNESALDLLEQAYRDRSFSIIYLNVDPHFDQLRSNPRYRQLLHRLKFIDKI
jgi:TolB-like protein/Tfp pilus assembly protein PilF